MYQPLMNIAYEKYNLCKIQKGITNLMMIRTFTS